MPTSTDRIYQIVAFTAGMHPPSSLWPDIMFAFMGDIVQVSFIHNTALCCREDWPSLLPACMHTSTADRPWLQRGPSLHTHWCCWCCSWNWFGGGRLHPCGHSINCWPCCACNNHDSCIPDCFTAVATSIWSPSCYKGCCSRFGRSFLSRERWGFNHCGKIGHYAWVNMQSAMALASLHFRPLCIMRLLYFNNEKKFGHQPHCMRLQISLSDTDTDWMTAPWGHHEMLVWMNRHWMEIWLLRLTKPWHNHNKRQLNFPQFVRYKIQAW